MNLEKHKKNTFEGIKYLDDNGQEYWLARELVKVLDYSDHFVDVINMVQIG
jgi:DNA-damage-inducible protein D